MKTTPEAPAFPFEPAPTASGSGTTTPARMMMDAFKQETSGLTKREYFAAAALQGLAARNTLPQPEDLAARAVEYADALMAELNK